jgi:pSer/pThr/pTyr-binding forkhead associated (FHA) protein
MGKSIHGKNRQEGNSMTTLQIIGGPLMGEAFNLEGETVFIGRSSKNDIQIKDATISRKQIKLYRIGTKLFLEDLKSTNGSWLNDSLVLPGEGFEVGEGDIITLGNTIMLITDAPSLPARISLSQRLKPLPKAREDLSGNGVKNCQAIWSLFTPCPNSLDHR